MRTQNGDVITVCQPAAGSETLSLLWVNKLPMNRACQLTLEEAADLARQLATAVARKRGVLLVADAAAAGVVTGAVWPKDDGRGSYE
ncbi:MAG: hypothetical protein NTY19_00735 [Planctomycetota bacterium]|nr:hypothetical protein [Planctomycetota bacterium]